MNTKKNIPVPQGKYRPAVRHNELIYTSGMTPRKQGKLLYEGKILASDPVDAHRPALRLATENALIAASSCLQPGERIDRVLQLQVYVNAEDGFTAHAALADVASEFLMERLGAGCMGARAAIGVATLPMNAPVEITLLALAAQ
ncbi:RidA family protein [Maribacter sp. 2307ULW6-5]|uniref:RidA family protein n=1 Tax=Maribacter sp. 2307ULW6-5 TaxID=3386275 RepID=UPI0039BD7A3D